jgi:hypothetical protein
VTGSASLLLNLISGIRSCRCLAIMLRGFIRIKISISIKRYISALVSANALRTIAFWFREILILNSKLLPKTSFRRSTIYIAELERPKIETYPRPTLLLAVRFLS